MSDLILVTGATGLIGRRLLCQLLERHARVRIIARRPELLPPELTARLDIVRGDIRSDAVVDRALRGAHTVLHLAACARPWAPDPTEFQAVNVDAVAALLAAAARYDVQRFVHVSTVLTITGAADRSLTHYETTKLAGERLVEASGRGIVVHPTRVYGPGPLNDANGATRVIAAYLAGTFRFRLQDGDVCGNYVHVDDVAGGIVHAALRGRIGAHYVLGGANASMRSLLDAIARISGVHHHVFQLHPRAALAVAAAAEWCGRAGLHVLITRDWVRLFLQDQRVDIGATSAALGYTPRDLDTGLAQTIGWLRSLKRRAA